MSNLKHKLSQFTGSERFFRNPLFPHFTYTEGVQYLAEKAGAYWLIDYIFGYQSLKTIRQQEFQVWRIIVAEGKSAVINLEDGNKNIVEQFTLKFTDFPLKDYSLWFVNNTLLLPSEY